VDVRAIRPAHAAQVEGDDGEISDRALAGYIAKYATKGASTCEVADRPIRSERAIEDCASALPPDDRDRLEPRDQ
jgi:hypothetical protein